MLVIGYMVICSLLVLVVGKAENKELITMKKELIIMSKELITNEVK